MKAEPIQELELPEATEEMLGESRMVLPGLQALFGFQLIAVFSTRFSIDLTRGEQQLHLLAIGLVAVAVALVMGTAAYHRQTGPRRVSVGFLRLASRLLLWAMVALMVALGLDFYLIARVILHNPQISLILSVALLAWFSLVWFVLPRWRLLRGWLGDRSENSGTGRS